MKNHTVKTQLIKWCPKESNYRNEYNQLVKATFGFDFETWYQQGYWKEQHQPWSLFKNGQMVSNISCNPMELTMFGKQKHYLQIGTVMTAKAHMQNGYARQLMEQVMTTYQEQYPLIYLFANDSVLDFYPKFGFEQINQVFFERSVKPTLAKHNQLEALDMENEEHLDLAKRLFVKGNPYSAVELKNNLSLQMFYGTGFYQNKLWYLKEKDALLVAEWKDSILIIYDIFMDNLVDMEGIISDTVNEKTSTVQLFFTPKDSEQYSPHLLTEKDTLFVAGKDKEFMKTNPFLFSFLSHT